jgi:DNA (cytosine-5)-methyltransferase 1
VDVLAAVEYDPICASVHQFNFPRTEIVCGDVATLTAKAVKTAATKGWRAHGHRQPWNEKIDLVIGGPPCQGFSVIGKRAFDDPRNQLVFSFARLVGGLKPRYFVMENVPGLASVRAGAQPNSPRLLDLLLEEFSSFGYDVLEPRVLNSYNFGVPQYRRRLILIGWRKGENPVAYPSSETRGRTRQGRHVNVDAQEAALPPCPTVHDAIGDLPDLDKFPILSCSDEVLLTKTELSRQRHRLSSYASRLYGVSVDQDDCAYPREWDASLLTSSQKTNHAPEVAKRFSETDQGHPEKVSRFFRLHGSGVSPTLRAGTHYDRGSFNAPRPIHPDRGRVISVREAARLHSYPDWFRFHWTKWHGFREVGNSLPPRLARAVVAEVVKAAGARPSRPKKAIGLGDPELLYLENIPAATRFNADLTRIPRNALRKRSREGMGSSAHSGAGHDRS